MSRPQQWVLLSCNGYRREFKIRCNDYQVRLHEHQESGSPVKLCFRVAAIRVRIVNLVSVIGFALNAFTLHTKGNIRSK